MEDNIVETPITDEAAAAAFDEGWADEAAVDFETEEGPNSAGGQTPPTQQEPPADGSSGAQTPGSESVPPADQQPGQPPAPKDPPLKYLRRTVDPSPEERAVLQQKGLDYDRIRGRLEEVQPILDVFHQAAQAEGLSDLDYVTTLRTQRLMQDRALSEAEARRAVAAQDQAAREEAAQRAQAIQRQAEEARTADLQRFAQLFPDAAAKPDTIPQPVWDQVNQGDTLAFAYQGYALNQANARIAELEQQLASFKQNETNQNRSTGSMGSAGNDLESKDAFLAGWNS